MERNRYLEKHFDAECLFMMEYPVTWFIVEVNYAAQDIAITECRAKRGDEPKEKDNSRGFTVNFHTYEAAENFARKTAQELKYFL